MFWECYHMHKQQLPDHSSFLHGVSLITVPNYIYCIKVNFERKLSWIGRNYDFCGENGVARLLACAAHPQILWRKLSQIRSHKTSKLAKIFSLESFVLKTKIRTKLHTHKPKHSNRTADNSESHQLYWACGEHKPQLALALHHLLNILSWVNAVYGLTFIDN